MSSVTISPSRPIAHNRSVGSLSDAGEHAPNASTRQKSETIANRALQSRVKRSERLLLKPPAAEPGLPEPTHDVRIPAHGFPDEIRAVVLDHRDDRPLVNSEAICIEPSPAADHLPRSHEHTSEL